MILDGFLDLKIDGTARKFRNHVKPACWTPNFPVDKDHDETNIQTDTPSWVSRFNPKNLRFLLNSAFLNAIRVTYDSRTTGLSRHQPSGFRIPQHFFPKLFR